MIVNRRVFIATALAAVAATAVGVVAFAGPGGSPAGRGRYHPGPGGRHVGPGSMVMQDLNGRWVSHLLPFAAPFPNRGLLEAELARARARGLVR